MTNRLLKEGKTQEIENIQRVIGSTLFDRIIPTLLGIDARTRTYRALPQPTHARLTGTANQGLFMSIPKPLSCCTQEPWVT